jgi:four helix bundle protein
VKSPINIDERAFQFVCDVIGFVRTVRPEPGVRRLIDQLVSAAGSIAANRQEANSASSRREFIRYNEIALRSAKEASLWLRVFQATALGRTDECQTLVDESRQLALILGSIVVNTKANRSTENF